MMAVALTLIITIIINGCVSIIDNSDNPNHPCISALAQIYAESLLGLHRIPPSARDINSMPGESRKRKRSSSDSSSAIFCYTVFSYYVIYSKMCYQPCVHPAIPRVVVCCAPLISTCPTWRNRLGLLTNYYDLW